MGVPPVKSDFEIIQHKFANDIKIYPIADVHFGSIQHQQKEWERFLNHITQEDDAYLVLNGDLLNNNTRNAVGSPWEDTIRPREAKKLMIEYLEPIKDRILAITTGNHERRSAKDADCDLTYDIACKLDLEDLYRENICFMKIGVGERDKGYGRKEGVSNSYTFAITHGTGGGIMGGATLNRNERFGTYVEGLDCVIVGHTHRGQVSRPSKMVFDKHNNHILFTEYLVISCIPWLSYGGYAVQKMLPPSSGVPRPQVLQLSGERKNKNITVTW